MKKPIITVAKPAPQIKEKPAVVASSSVPAPKSVPTKPTPAKKVVKKVQETEKSAAATDNLAMSGRVGLTAGSIWHYLTENGATSVSVLVKALTEEEKVIQRSIGWLAQEDKITLETVGRVETVALKK